MEQLMSAWSFLGDLKPAQATIVGNAVGVLLGFFSLVAGALINASLNRRRDRYLHEFEQLNVLRAIVIEHAQISSIVRAQIQKLRDFDGPGEFVTVLNPSSLTIVQQNNLSKLQMLPGTTIRPITEFYYGLKEHEHNVQANDMELINNADGTFKSISLPRSKIPTMIRLDEKLDHHIGQGLSSLYPVLADLESRFGTKLKGPDDLNRASHE